MEKRTSSIEGSTPDFGSVKESFSTLADHGSEVVGDIRARVGEVSGEARDAAMAAFDEAEKFISANPLKSLALAFGTGYLAMRVRTSPLFPLAVIGGIGYAIKRSMK